MNKPEFLGPFRSLKIAYKSLYSYSSKNNPGLPYIIRLRKNLLLNRMVKFNGQYYSSLTVPAYPSPAYDLMVEKNGLFFDKMGSGEKRNLESAFLGISSKCHNNCTHCYEQHNLSTDGEVPVEKWIETVKTLQEMGTNIIILTGGEPLLRYNELLKVLRAGDKNKSDFHIHTSGITLTIEKAAQLKLAGLKAAAVGFEDH
ncbi:MAG: radical SAM protein, partial [Methanococcaceae archaeon]